MTLTEVDLNVGGSKHRWIYGSRGGGHFRHMPSPFWVCPKNYALDWKCSENGKNHTKSRKKKKKGLFREALVLTTSHLVDLVIILYIINVWS